MSLPATSLAMTEPTQTTATQAGLLRRLIAMVYDAFLLIALFALVSLPIVLALGKDHPINENWLLLLRVIYFEQKDYDNMTNVVKELIAYYPKDTYVLTLAGIYSELGDTKKRTLKEDDIEGGGGNAMARISSLPITPKTCCGRSG